MSDKKATLNNMQMQIKKNNSVRGSVLLLSLLVLSVLMVSSISLGSIVINDIRQAGSIDNSIVAYYAAESGVERTLYRLRKQDQQAVDLANSRQALTNEAEWFINNYGSLNDEQVDVSDKEEKLFFAKLAKDNFVQLDLFGTNGESANIKSLRVKGEGEGFEVAEVSWFGWSAGGNLSNIKTQLLFHGFLAEEDGRVVNLTRIDPRGDYDFYRIKIRALYGDINNLEVTAYNDTAGTIPEEGIAIPSRIVARVHGEYRNSRQSLQYTMPRQSPLGGLFDFVIFSECSILKGISEECE